MKRFFCAVGILLHGVLAATGLYAQTPAVPYQYAYSTSSYANLGSNTTLILGNTGWDDTLVHFSLPTDFNFKYQGAPVTNWALDTYGGLFLNGFDTVFGTPALLGIQSDYIDNGQSKISYALTGTPGSRITKIEFRNMGFYNGTAADSANFQVWLYEGTDKIEYHAGPGHTTPGMFDPGNNGNVLLVGLTYNVHITDSLLLHTVRYRSGANTDTALVASRNNHLWEDIAPMVYDTAVYPANGAVFVFTPKTGTTLREVTSLISKVMPNPATDNITLQLKHMPLAGASVTISTLAGQQVVHRFITSARTDISLHALAKGVYLLSYVSGGQRETLKIIKQ
ncbi:T9SS type A sorting domain-containing protein [Taibaiella chishuiensis]|uniref:Putative secreted protein (Por secretion system target) n=1 Tax=Taibaiella chishuiensis TaxID=1434707 RepID=A0A2P8D4F9_9BACT|nr:T9SS type A sorting domain-containing protein [Taibaiella chishuiensis]PSK92059.1 putative secreted protein (Por secretion system target) [Taibaiella chishuiensis]